jgi:hypothetical protein
MQQVYAILFAGGVTFLCGVAILYFDYNFWGEKYSQQDIVLEKEITADTTRSPFDMLSSLTQEVKDILDKAQKDSAVFFEATDQYSQKESFLAGTTTVKK